MVLAVAINNYAQEKHNLGGCHNDLNGLIAYLKKYIDTELWGLQSQTLKDEEATREEIINTFKSFFGQLQDGDSALFYFSGHGSQAHAPEVFWHELPSKLLETIVCYDSRTSHSRDLYDKEISYLIWKVTRNKDVHFTVILDCCHSGSATRSPAEKVIDDQAGVRMRDAGKKKVHWKDYLGSKEYLPVANGVEVPVGKHVLIAACRRTEKASERNLNFKRRGVFTYALLKALEQSKGNITYSALLQKTQAVVYNFTKSQHPQLEAHGFSNVGQVLFLNGGIKQLETDSLVYYDVNTKQWIFNRGAIHGLVPNQGIKKSIKIYFKELGNGQPDFSKGEVIPLEKISANFSTLKVPARTNQTKQFPARIYQAGLPKLKVWLDNEDLFNKIKNASNPEKDTPYLEWCFSKSESDYKILQHTRAFQIQSVKIKNPFLKSIQSEQPQSILTLIRTLKHISAWHQIKSINNPSSNIRNEELQLSFFRVTEISTNGLEMAREEAVDDFLSKSVKLHYSYNEAKSKWEEPAFRFKFVAPLSNRRPLWVSLLFQGTDYSITNELCPLLMLQPGESKYLEALDPLTGFYTKVIPLHIQKQYYQQGIKSITEHFKLFIATEEFDTRIFNQNGLALSDGQDTRALFRMADLEQLKFVDWKVVDFSVKVIRP